MDDKLKNFISRHRQEFDADQPGKEVWEAIDAQLSLQPSRISSKWLSKFTYLGFSATVLVVVICFMVKHFNPSSAKGQALDKTDSLLRASENYYPSDPYKTELNKSEGNDRANATTSEINGSGQGSDISGRADDRWQKTANNKVQDENDSVPGPARRGSDPAETSNANEQNVNYENALRLLSTKEKEEATTHTSGEKRNERARAVKKTEVYIPAEPEDVNSYTATLYESAQLCDLVRAYKFPGKVNMNTSFGHRQPDGNYKIIVKTTSCSRLEDIVNIKAIWLKGKTDKALTISIKRKLKNIVLLKPDGRKISPEAISHYYRGQGVITDYKGKYFKMVFKDRVGLILFFKDAQEGDKISVDDIIEAVVKGQP